MDVLVVTNMYPTPERPALGPFVRDQVEALRRRGDLSVELFHFPPGPRALAGAARALRRRYGPRRRFDVVHAHFGLSAWPALLARLGPVAVTLHGNDLLVARSRAVTLAALPFCALVATASRELAGSIPGAGSRRRVAVLPVGIDTVRFTPRPRREARRRLGLPEDEPFVLFPHDPARPLKRHDRAVAAAAAAGVRLRVLGGVPPADVPLWVNAANAVLVPSAKEGFGLSVIEALACDVPVLGTPVGIHPVALAGVAGAHCLPWDRDAWASALRPYVLDPDPRAEGRARAGLFSAEAMADRTVVAWRALAGAQAPVEARREAGPDVATRGGRGRCAREHALPPRNATYTRPPRCVEQAGYDMNGLSRRLTRRRAADPEDPATGSGDGPAEPEGRRSLLEDPGATQPIPLGEISDGTTRPAAAQAESPRSGQDLPAGLDEDELAARPDASARRGRIRRRVRFLLAARELLLRDLGGFVYEIQRTAGGQGDSHASLRDRKVERLESIDRELDDLRRRLGDPAAPAVLRQPGVGGECPVCGDLFASDQEFCGRDGTPLTRNAQRSRERELDAALQARGEASTTAGAAPAPAADPAGGAQPARTQDAEAPTVIEPASEEAAFGRRRGDDT